MAKLNLKSPLRLMEDFMAGEISKPQDTTAPAVKTDSKTISLDIFVFNNYPKSGS